MNSAGTSLAELAQRVDGEVVGDAKTIINRVAAIDDARTGDITFLGDPRYHKFLASCRASAVLVDRAFEIPARIEPSLAFVRVADPYAAFARIHLLFNPPPQHSGTVSAGAFIDPGASVGEGVTAYPHVYVGKSASVGPRTVLMPGVFIGEGARVGADCVLHPNAVVEYGCRLGDRVTLHAGVVVGSDGFGYTGHGSQRLKVPQAGIVEIADDVEVGANTTIDRATMGRTYIGAGAKIDNLVQLAHNVTVGDGSLVIAQAAIAGSSAIGKNCIVAGQVGVRDHVKIGDNSIIGPKSGIGHNVAPGSILSGGLEAGPHAEWLRVMTLVPKLPKLWTRVLALERKVRALTGGTRKEVS